MKNKNIPKPTNYEDWFESLPLDKQMYVAQHVKKRIDKIQYETEMILDSCYIAAMIEVFDMNLSNCIEIAKKANENMDETSKILSKEGEKYYMKINDDVLREEIKVEVKGLISENTKINNLEIIKLLGKDYDLPKKDLQILIKEAREEMANEALKELEKEINVKEVAEEIKIEVFKDGEKVNLEELPVAEIKPTLKLNDGFKIKSMEIEGKYGIYIRNNEGVKHGDRVYQDIKDLNNCRKNLDIQVESNEKRINEQMGELKKQLEKLSKDKKEELEKYAEIEQIFAI